MSLAAEGLPELVTFLGARLIASELHERAHACAAMLLGHKPASRPFGARATIVPGISKEPFAQAFVQHSGWVVSVLLALAVSVLEVSRCVAYAFWLVAAEALCSDLCHVGNFCTGGDYFYCGNFGLLLLDQRHAGKVAPTLLQMMRVVAMRGAQSAGMVTYLANRDSGRRGLVGARHR